MEPATRESQNQCGHGGISSGKPHTTACVQAGIDTHTTNNPLPTHQSTPHPSSTAINNTNTTYQYHHQQQQPEQPIPSTTHTNITNTIQHHYQHQYALLLLLTRTSHTYRSLFATHSLPNLRHTSAAQSTLHIYRSIIATYHAPCPAARSTDPRHAHTSPALAATRTTGRLFDLWEWLNVCDEVMPRPLVPLSSLQDSPCATTAHTTAARGIWPLSLHPITAHRAGGLGSVRGRR